MTKSSGSTFKRGIEQILMSRDFARTKTSLVRHDSGVSTLLSCERNFGNHWSINVGFWIEALGGQLPDRVEMSHLYFRLERLMPAHHEIIVLAGTTNDLGQPEAYRQLLRLFEDDIDVTLRALGTIAGLRDAMKQGQLSQGLVRKEAREYLLT